MKARGWGALAFLCFAAAVPARADFGSGAIGTTSAGFLKLGVGARAAALGEAYAAVADDATALYWNPAAMTRVERRSATFMHAAYIDSSYFDYLGFAQNLGSWGHWGLGVQYLSAGSIGETDINGADVGNFTPNDLAVSLGYAYKLKNMGALSLMEGFSVGVTGKFIRSKIIDSAQTGAVDLGLLSPAYIGDKLNMALTVSNLGGKMKFENESAELPLMIRLGSAYKIQERWSAGLDVVFPRDNDPHVGVGTEYLLPVKDAWNLAGRLGFNSRTIGSVDGFTGISFGIGLAASRSLGVDYGFAPFGSIGNAHRFSLSFKF